MEPEPEPEPKPETSPVADDGEDMLGFNLFESCAARRTEEFAFGAELRLKIVCLDDEPIGVQSGQLLWPAAPALCRHIVSVWNTLPRGTVLELGAGCGMVGIVAARLGAERVVLTDRDVGALEMVAENISAAAVGAQCRYVPA